MEKRAGKARSLSLENIEPNAAGIDVGATEVYVAVPPDRDAEPVRHFKTFTGDLREMAAWLLRCGITTVAMESTGVYWMAPYEILEEAGMRVCLVNAQHVRHVPGRKSDVSDCQWLQYLHTVGLLKASFRPDASICALRALSRHRASLVESAAAHIQHMQKALTQMNLQIHHVLSDITGLSGMAIVEAIVAGQRDPDQLACLCHGGVRSDRQTIIRSLTGNYRPEHLFTLKQSLAAYKNYQQLLAECDQEIQRLTSTIPDKTGRSGPAPQGDNRRKRRKNQFHFDMSSELYRLFGVACAVSALNSGYGRQIAQARPSASRSRRTCHPADITETARHVQPPNCTSLAPRIFYSRATAYNSFRTTLLTFSVTTP